MGFHSCFFVSPLSCRQTAFLEEYFNQKETIFRNVALLIYVFDVQSSNRKTDEDYFRRTIEALRDYSPSARVFCLIHKVDLLTEAQSNTVFKKREAELTKISVPMRIQCFKTSIWNETLFKAWSQIVYSLVPNVDTLEQHLTTFCKHSCADEVVLFERSTFLVISHVSTKAFHDEDRFEKVSNIIKQFKLSCGKVGSQFSSMEVRNSSFTGFIDALTDTTMVMVIISDPTLTSPAINMNIRSARKHFSPLIEGHAYKSER